jgi:type IV secretion system protein VirB5
MAIACCGILGVAPVSALVVYDPAAVAQLIKQLNAMAQQYRNLVAQLEQAKQTYNALTGSRPAASLLTALTDRAVYESLPLDSRAIVDQASGLLAQYGQLSRRINDAMKESTILTERSFHNDPNGYAAQRWKENVRRIAAQRGTADQLYFDAGERTKRLEQLLEAGKRNNDSKSALDYLGRMSVEGALLQNELIKAIMLQRVQDAEAKQGEQRERDRLYQMGQKGIPEVKFGKLFDAAD